MAWMKLGILMISHSKAACGTFSPYLGLSHDSGGMSQYVYCEHNSREDGQNGK